MENFYNHEAHHVVSRGRFMVSLFQQYLIYKTPVIAQTRNLILSSYLAAAFHPPVECSGRNTGEFQHSHRDISATFCLIIRIAPAQGRIK